MIKNILKFKAAMDKATGKNTAVMDVLGYMTVLGIGYFTGYPLFSVFVVIAFLILYIGIANNIGSKL